MLTSSAKMATPIVNSKRKRVVLSLEKKLEVIEYLSKGFTQSEAARNFGVARSTVSDIKKSEEKLREFCTTMDDLSMPTKSRKVMRQANDNALDEALYLWFVQQRSLGAPVSGPILCEKALQLNAKIHTQEDSTSSSAADNNFKASKGWLWRFCNRHGMKQLAIQGESLSSDTSAVDPFKEKLKKLIESESLTLTQIYNCDETGLFYKMLPNKTLSSRNEKKAPGYKLQKDRVTLLACSNATGSHKLPLAVIGKYANPRCFKNVNKDALPVAYFAQKNGWMNAEIFSTWFHHHFTPAVTRFLKDQCLPVKALLLMDNAPAHPEASSLSSKEGNIKAVFLPANTTAVLQPMDQGVLVAVKKRYKRAMLQMLLIDNEDNSTSLMDSVKQIDMKKVVYMSASAWNDITSSTISNSWHQLLRAGSSQDQSTIDPHEEQISCDSLAVQLDSNLTSEDIDTWLGEDANDPGYQLLTDDEIVQAVTEQASDTESDEDEEGEDTVTMQAIPPHKEVASMLDKCLLWYEQQKESRPSSLLLLKEIRDLAVAKRHSNLKQTKLTSFYS